MFDLENILIISCYDMGYVFTVFWKGVYYYDLDSELTRTAYRVLDTIDNKEKFEILANIDMFPDVIISCEDGCIDIILRQ